MNKLATVLLCINFITVLFPQPGYIHPDEFFQSVEVVAGDVLNVTHIRTWEFNPNFPLRSIVFPYILTAPPLNFLHWLNETRWTGFHFSTDKIIMSTRLPLAFFSVVGYLATRRLAHVFNVDQYLSAVLYCSSYVTWVYYTRTFSNTVESVLLALLLILTVSPICSRNYPFIESNQKLSTSLENDLGDCKNGDDDDRDKVNDDSDGECENDYQNIDSNTPRSEGGEKIYCKARGKVGNKDREVHSKDCSEKGRDSSPFFLGVILTAGCFNRPTFVLFSFIPVLLWLYLQSYLRFDRFIKNLLSLAAGGLVTCVTFITVDSIYYRPAFVDHVALFFHHISHGSPPTIDEINQIVTSLVVTPINFILYNIDPSNLAQHGTHPRILHVFVNLPLLLGPLYIPVLLTVCISLYQYVRRTHTQREDTLGLHWLSLMAVFPVLFLSIFPHQEPRFLIPALPVFVVLGTKLVSAMTPGKLSFFALWVMFNLLLTFLYGYVHQGALIPAMSIYQQKLAADAGRPIKHTAIFYKTYPPPKHLLLIPESSPLSRRVDIIDMAGASAASVQSAVEDSRARCKGSNCKTFVFAPATVTPWLEDRLHSSFKLQTTSICPHLSMEAAPRFKAWWNKRIKLEEFLMDFCLNIINIT